MNVGDRVCYAPFVELYGAFDATVGTVEKLSEGYATVLWETDDGTEQDLLPVEDLIGVLE